MRSTSDVRMKAYYSQKADIAEAQYKEEQKARRIRVNVIRAIYLFSSVILIQGCLAKDIRLVLAALVIVDICSIAYLVRYYPKLNHIYEISRFRFDGVFDLVHCISFIPLCLLVLWFGRLYLGFYVYGKIPEDFDLLLVIVLLIENITVWALSYTVSKYY